MKVQEYHVNADQYTGLYIPDKEDDNFLSALQENYIIKGRSLAEVWRPIVLLKSVPAMDSDFGYVNVSMAVVNPAAKQVIEPGPGGNRGIMKRDGTMEITAQNRPVIHATDIQSQQKAVPAAKCIVGAGKSRTTVKGDKVQFQ